MQKGLTPSRVILDAEKVKHNVSADRHQEGHLACKTASEPLVSKIKGTDDWLAHVYLESGH